MAIAPTSADAAPARPATHTAAAHPAHNAHPWKLEAPGVLQSGNWLTSPSGQYILAMQTDGNLVLYWRGIAIWASNTRGHLGDVLDMQTDGNLVIYQGKHAIWASFTSHPGSLHYFLAVQNDGNVVIYSPTSHPVWATHSNVGQPVGPGATGTPVKVLQVRLSALGYWVGTPDGNYGDSTIQAIYALQKAAGLGRDGVAGSQTWSAIERGVVPTPRAASGYLIEVDLNDDLLMVVNNGKLLHTLNTSTGGGYTYTDQGVTSVAITPQGVFHTYAEIDGIDVDSLGTLWRAKFFTGGYAIHGDSYVPPYPVSHGCVRVSDEAINWIWSANIDPIGTEVWVY